MNKEELIAMSQSFLQSVKHNTKVPFRSRGVRKNGFFAHQMRLIQLYTALKSDGRVDIKLRRKERNRVKNIMRTHEINLPPDSQRILSAIGDMVIGKSEEINKVIHSYRIDGKSMISYYNHKDDAIHPVLELIFTKLVNDMRADGVPVPADETEWQRAVMDPLPRDFADALSKCLVTFGFSRQELRDARMTIRIEQEREVDYLSLMTFPDAPGNNSD